MDQGTTRADFHSSRTLLHTQLITMTKPMMPILGCSDLWKIPHQKQAIQDSFLDLLARGFIVPVNDLPQDCRESLQTKTKVYIPTSVAYKSSSHSTKVRICWDLSRKTGIGIPLNAQLLRGAANYSMTETLIAWRRGRYALSCDIAKFYNNLRLHPEHYNLHMAVWRRSMSPSADRVETRCIPLPY